MRKEHPAFRMKTAKEITDNIRFIDNLPKGVIGYKINGKAVNDSWKEIAVFFNGTSEIQSLPFPMGGWEKASVSSYDPYGNIPIDALILIGYSRMILYKK